MDDATKAINRKCWYRTEDGKAADLPDDVFVKAAMVAGLVVYEYTKDGVLVDIWCNEGENHLQPDIRTDACTSAGHLIQKTDISSEVCHLHLYRGGGDRL